MHVAARAQVQVFAVIDDRQVEATCANSMARRITRAFITGRPSSEMATMPGVLHGADGGQFLARAVLGDRADGKDVDHGVLARRARRCSW